MGWSREETYCHVAWIGLLCRERRAVFKSGGLVVAAPAPRFGAALDGSVKAHDQTKEEVQQAMARAAEVAAALEQVRVFLFRVRGQ